MENMEMSEPVDPMHAADNEQQALGESICASRARAQLGATEKILKSLPCKREVNRRYRSAAPLRLYVTQEVIEAVQKASDHKEAERVYYAENQDTIEAEKASQRRQAAQQTAEAAALKISAFTAQPENPAERHKRFNTGLPTDVWSLVLEMLCPDSLDIVHSPSVVARNIINAKIACHDLNQAGATALLKLGCLIKDDLSTPLEEISWLNCSIRPGINPGMPDANLPWDELISNPLTFKVNVLKQACRALGEQVSGVKNMLVLRILSFFDCEKPTTAPAALLFAVKQEKLPLGWWSKHTREIEVTLRFHSRMPADRLLSGFEARKILCHHYKSASDMFEHARGIQGSLTAAAAAASQAKVWADKVSKNPNIKCRCGQQPAFACSQGCCKSCCCGPCQRHSVP